MTSRLISIIGVAIAFVCLYTGTTFYPGGYDWKRDYISTMLRGPAGPSRTYADIGAIIFCLSIALIFARLARVSEFSKNSKIIQISGIGSMIYSCLAMTPLHDLMVSISIVFFLVAAVFMTQSLFANREFTFAMVGGVCLILLLTSAAIYYSGVFTIVLPWAQRATYSMFAIWLIALDLTFPRRIPPSVAEAHA